MWAILWNMWYFGKETDGYIMIHLINTLGNTNDWRDDNQDKNAPIDFDNRYLFLLEQ